jgi:hypothetical protein
MLTKPNIFLSVVALFGYKEIVYKMRKVQIYAGADLQSSIQIENLYKNILHIL